MQVDGGRITGASHQTNRLPKANALAGFQAVRKVSEVSITGIAPLPWAIRT